MLFFSIIIPVYNLEMYLHECLDSVLAQTIKNWECICVDDGSTDASATIADEYAKFDSRFRVVHKNNGGEGSARNTGLDLASGEWICYLDADDIWHRSFLEDITRMIENVDNVDMVSVRQQNFIDGQDCEWSNDRNGTIEVFDNRKSLDSKLFGIGVWSTAYKRAIFGDLRFTHYVIGADRVYTMRCLSRSCFAAIMDNRDYGYRIRQNSMAHNEWTSRKVLSSIGFTRECVFEIASCGKDVQRSIIRVLCSRWLERNPILIASINDKLTRRDLKQQWLNGINTEHIGQSFPLWYRFICFILSTTKRYDLISNLFVLIFCILPYKLKSKGLHRK